MNPWSSLQPFVRRASPPHASGGCELCGAALAPVHAHLADLELHTFACACPACALLFRRDRGGGGRWRALPERHLQDPAFSLSDLDWEALGIPVSMAFFFRSSEARGAWTAVYPSPAGPVESLLGLGTWASLAERTGLARELEWDVEALLVSALPEQGYDCLLVPIHACYELVGHVRRSWRGFSGGEDVRRVIAEHCRALRQRCQAWNGAGA